MTGSGAVRDPCLDAEGRIDEDIICVGCGYNLRTLRMEAACPECNTSVRYGLLGPVLGMFGFVAGLIAVFVLLWSVKVLARMHIRLQEVARQIEAR